MKRIIAILISLLLLCSVLTGCVGSADKSESEPVTENITQKERSSENPEADYSFRILEDDSASITGYYGSASELDIPSSLYGRKVTRIFREAFYGNNDLNSVTIPDSVTEIDDIAFCKCSNLTSVTIPDSVTSISSTAFDDTPWYDSQPDGLVYAGKCAYRMKGECPATVTIADGTKSICKNAFEECETLTSVTIPDSVTTISEYAFMGCSSLVSVTIPDSVTSIGLCAFDGCSGLESITIPDSVTDLGEAFSDTAWYDNQPDGMIYIGNTAYKMKGECPAEVTIKDGTSAICGSAFKGCETLTSVTIPDSVTSIGYLAFALCTSMTSVSIPDSVKRIDSQAFLGCESLESITFPDSLENIGYQAFEATAWLDNQPDGLIYAGKCAYLMKGTCPSEVAIKEGTLSICGKAFQNCSELTSVTIPDSVSCIDSWAFSGCINLSSVTFPDSLVDIGADAFEKCRGLTSVTIPDSVMKIGVGAFSNCNNLTSVTIPKTTYDIGVLAFEKDEGTELSINGYAGSLAEAYAYKNGIDFNEI